jgi:2-polyprenyl-3-methyl-5-hydroxy-6-metoxy-1,4-benzoquinol methylase
VTDKAEEYRLSRQKHWARIAQEMTAGRFKGRYYHRRLAQVYRHLIPPGARVVELGSGPGRLLAAVEPSQGIGVDFSEEMVTLAGASHPHLGFIQSDVHDLALDETFDFIILSDLVHDLWDLQEVLTSLRSICESHTRIILNFYSRLWELPLAFAKSVNLARPVLQQNWFTSHDVSNILELSGYETLRGWQEVLLPISIPLASSFANRFLVKLWPINHLGLTNFLVARPKPAPSPSQPRVSVVVPARNEAGNIEAIVERTPEMGSGTELVFVEGGSSDNTWETIEHVAEAHGDRDIKTLQQPGKGKGDAVRHGFAAADGDILLILDADITVPPEDLPSFVAALTSGHGEFINGVRLVYPMENAAMRPLNFIANKLFGLTFSWLLGQPVKDTLCGTKVVWRRDWETILRNRGYFGDFDPYGDFDLLFGAAKLNLKIVDLPVRYRERTYGSTNIDRWAGGWLLFRMVMVAARKLKFV